MKLETLATQLLCHSLSSKDGKLLQGKSIPNVTKKMQNLNLISQK